MPASDKRLLRRGLQPPVHAGGFPSQALARRGPAGSLLFANMGLWIGRTGEFESPYFHLKALNPHSIDMLRHFCGEITEVQLFAMKAPGRTLWSTTPWNFRFASGMVGHLTSSYDIDRGHPMERVEVAGVNGRFVIERTCGGRRLCSTRRGDPVKSVYTNPVFGGYRDFDDTFGRGFMRLWPR